MLSITRLELFIECFDIEEEGKRKKKKNKGDCNKKESLILKITKNIFNLLFDCTCGGFWMIKMGLPFTLFLCLFYTTTPCLLENALIYRMHGHPIPNQKQTQRRMWSGKALLAITFTVQCNSRVRTDQVIFLSCINKYQG